MAFDYEEMRRIYRLEKATSRLVEVPDDFFYQVHDLIERERKAYLDSLQDLNTTKARDFSNLKKLVEELFSIREKKLLNTVLVSTRLQEIDDAHMSKEEKELFYVLFGSLNTHRSLTQKVLDANREFISTKTISLPPKISIEQKSEMKREEKIPKEKEIISMQVNSSSSATATASVSAQRIRILSEIPSFVGTDMKEYGPYKPEQVVELPQKIAQLFVSRKLGENA